MHLLHYSYEKVLVRYDGRYLLVMANMENKLLLEIYKRREQE